MELAIHDVEPEQIELDVVLKPLNFPHVHITVSLEGHKLVLHVERNTPPSEGDNEVLSHVEVNL